MIESIVTQLPKKLLECSEYTKHGTTIQDELLAV